MIDRDLLYRAWRFAAQHHGDQRMPSDNLPYMAHVGAVVMETMATVLAEPFAQPTTALVVAALHDVLEDTECSAEDIRSAFGDSVAAGVRALSKNSALPKEQRMLDSLRRIQRQPNEVWLVKLADRSVNMQPPPAHWTRAKCEAYRSEAQMILDELGAASPLQAARLRELIVRYPVPS